MGDAVRITQTTRVSEARHEVPDLVSAGTKVIDMFGWRRNQSATAKAERAIGEIEGRAAVRDTEEIVVSVWIDTLRQRHGVGDSSQLLEQESALLACARRQRAAEAEEDHHRLTSVAAKITPS